MYEIIHSLIKTSLRGTSLQQTVCYIVYTISSFQLLKIKHLVQVIPPNHIVSLN